LALALGRALVALAVGEAVAASMGAALGLVGLVLTGGVAELQAPKLIEPNRPRR
jgi:hypothetical protein